jgi:hypothetical protein
MRITEKTVRSVLHRRKLVQNLVVLEARLREEIRKQPDRSIRAGPYTLTVDESGRLLITETGPSERARQEKDQLALDL